MDTKATGGASFVERAQRLSMWSKGNPDRVDSDSDDVEIKRLDDDEGFVDFTKVRDGRHNSLAGG